MQARHINWLLILIALSVAAVTTAQIFWMYNAYKLQDENFKANALKSVQQTTELIEIFYGCFETFNKIELDKKENLIILLTKQDGVDSEVIDTIRQFSNIFHTDSLIPYKTSLPYPSTGEILIKYHYNPVDSGTDFTALNQHNHFDKIHKNFKDSVFSGTHPVTYFMGEEFFNRFLDSILNQYLKENGITTPYFYCLKNNRDDNFILGNVGADYASETEPFTSNLYESSFFYVPQKLYLWLPEKQVYLFSSMRNVLIGSFLVLIVLISVAYAMARTILKQKKLSQMKKDFINNMTHEFKTPIANITLAIDTIENLKLLNGDGKIKNYLKIIGDENKRLEGNVEKILEISQLDDEKIPFLWESFSLTLLIAEVIRTYELSIKEKGGNIFFNQEGENFSVKGDRTHLSNVFHNLIDNAMKYNNNVPHIAINIKQKEHMVQISVADNGIGMSSDQIANIFTPFYRIPTGDKHDVKGFGLGLSYVKKVVAVHGGDIKVESELGKGSTFVINLPVIVDVNKVSLIES
jgi:signal transduction histidine kinase